MKRKYTIAEQKNDKVIIKNLSLDQLRSTSNSVDERIFHYQEKVVTMNLMAKSLYFSLREIHIKINTACVYSRKTLTFTIPQAIAFYTFFIDSDYVATPVHYISSLIHQKLI